MTTNAYKIILYVLTSGGLVVYIHTYICMYVRLSRIDNVSIFRISIQSALTILLPVLYRYLVPISISCYSASFYDSSFLCLRLYCVDQKIRLDSENIIIKIGTNFCYLGSYEIMTKITLYLFVHYLFIYYVQLSTAKLL